MSGGAKKTPKSITVTVRNGGDFRAESGDRIWLGRGVKMSGAWEPNCNIRFSFPNTPEPPYRVTYTLNPQGKYKVGRIRKWRAIRGPGVEMMACILPDAWRGLRVSRRVEKVKK